MRRFYPGQEFLKYFKEKTEGKSQIFDQTYELFYDYAKGKFDFSDLDYSKCIFFYVYMIQGSRTRKQLSFNQASRHLKCLKSILRQAYEEELLQFDLCEELEQFGFLNSN